MPRWYDSRFMSFLVTGGTGFIGSYVIHNLLQHGHRVVCVDRSPDPDFLACLPPEATFIECDVSDRKQRRSLPGSPWD